MFNVDEVVLLAGSTVSINGVDVGHVDENGVKATFRNRIVQAQVARYGITPVQSWLSGQTLELDFALAQTNFANLAKAIPGVTVVTDTGGDQKITFGKIAGFLLQAVQLQFKSVQSVNVDKFDLTIKKAVPVGDWQIGYDPNNWQRWTCKWHGQIDEATGADGSFLAQFGDPAIVLDTNAPTVSSITPADEAVGVLTSAFVEWTISEDLDPDTVKGAGDPVRAQTVFLFEDPLGAAPSSQKSLAGTVLLTNAGAATKIRFTPTAALLAATQYTPFLSGDIKDKAGNRLQSGAGYLTDFTTA